jgi:hypothetical protein
MNAVARTSDSKDWNFVRMTGWSMVVLAVVGILMALVQVGLVAYLEHLEVFEFILEAPELSQAPAWLGWLLRHLLPLSWLLLALSLLTLLAGLGLLARRRWALWFSVAMFWIGALGNMVGIVLHAWLLHDFRVHLAGLPDWIMDLMAANYWSAQISGALFGLVFAAGFAWTAVKLQSAPVRAEFISPPP